MGNQIRARFGNALRSASKSPRNRAALAAVALTAVILSVNVLAVWIATLLTIDANASRRGTTDVAVVAFIVGSILLTIILAFFLFVGFHDVFRGRKVSALFRPIIAIVASIVVEVSLPAAQGMDYRIHGAAKWRKLYQPEVRIWQNASLIFVFLAFAWMLYVVMRGRGYRLRNVLALFVIVAGFALGLFFYFVSLHG